MKGKLTTTAVAAMAVTLWLAAPVYADERQDQAYLQSLSRMGFTGDDSSIFIAQATCREMDEVKANKSRDPIVMGLDMTLLNLAKGDWTVNQIFGVTGAAISTYCPQYSKEFYAAVGQKKITLP